MNALISYYLSIPFPEELDDETFIEKWEHVVYLMEIGIKNKGT